MIINTNQHTTTPNTATATSVSPLDQSGSSNTKFVKRKPNEPFDIPNLDEAIKRDFEAGLITLKEAANEFFKANSTFYVDIKYTKKKLGL